MLTVFTTVGMAVACDFQPLLRTCGCSILPYSRHMYQLSKQNRVTYPIGGLKPTQLQQIIINTPSMQRLKDLDIHGLAAVKGVTESFSRFEQAIYVATLSSMFLPEHPYKDIRVVCALLSGVSSKVFSSAICNDNAQQHLNFIKDYVAKEASEISEIALDFLNPEQCPLLEKKHSGMSVDHIAYIISASLREGYLDNNQALRILNQLSWKYSDSVKHGFFFRDTEAAFMLANASLRLQIKIWSNPAYQALNFWGTKTIERGLSAGYISEQDISRGKLPEVFEKLSNSDDEFLKKYIKNINNYKSSFTLTKKPMAEYTYYPSNYVLNPWVFNDNFNQLSDINPCFKKSLAVIQQQTSEGQHFIFKH